MARFFAGELFLEGTKGEKQILIRCISSNLFLKDKIISFELKKPFELLQEVNQSTSWLPLKDLFINQKLEFDLTLNDLKIAFENLGLSQPKPAFATL